MPTVCPALKDLHGHNSICFEALPANIYVLLGLHLKVPTPEKPAKPPIYIAQHSQVLQLPRAIPTGCLQNPVLDAAASESPSITQGKHRVWPYALDAC